MTDKERGQIKRYEDAQRKRQEREARKQARTNGVNGETEATAIGKQVSKERADERQESGLYDSVTEKLTDADGNVIMVPKTVRKDDGSESTIKQAAMPDAVLEPDKGGIIIDDKPARREVESKDYQEMGRNIEAYAMKYGVPPNEVRIEWYNPVTGKNEGYTSFPISKFIRERKK